MKYLLFDTNIYINMIVNRRNNISTKLITDFAALVAVGGIEIILPEIVKYETHKHLEEEIDAIGSLLDGQISGIKKLYWLTGFQEDEIDIEAYKRKAQRPLQELLDIFNRQHSKYSSDLKESIENIFDSEHTKVVDTSEELIQRVMKRKIYKKAPLHKDEKESLADALIAEILIGIKSYINLNDNDTIYFVTENYRDFSLDKNNKENFHPHIEDDLEVAGFRSQVKLINSFAKLIACELQDEIKNAHMELMFDEDALDDYFDLDKEAREMAGLSSLSGFQDYMEEYVSEHDQAQEIISVFEEISDEITKIEDAFAQYDDLLSVIEFEKLDQERITSFQQNMGIEREECSVEDFKDQLNVFMGETETEFQRLPDYLKVGENIKISTPSEKIFELSWSDYELNPESGESHTVFLQLINSGIVIIESHIEITYGYMNFDEDGNAADGCDEDIEVNFDEVILALKEILKEYQEFIGKHNHILDLIKNILPEVESEIK